MKITIRNTGTAARPVQSGIRSSNPYINRYGVWGIVRDVYSADHSVDVLIDAGVLLYHVPVSSKEWVVPGDEYTTGERNLPPAGARVFVMMPTGNFDGCFVLCSGLAVTDRAQQENFMGEDKAKIRKRVKPGNWKEEYHYATGTYEIVSPDDKTSIKIDYGTEDEPKDAPELYLNFFDELKIEHKTGDSTKLTIFDSEFTIKNKEVSIVSGGKIYIGGSADNVCALWLALIDELINFQTMGAPPQHITHPQTVANLNAFKNKIKALYKESV